MLSPPGRRTTEEALTTPAPARTPESDPSRTADREIGSPRAGARVRVLPVDPRTLYCFWVLEPTLADDLIEELGLRAASLCQLLLVVQSNDRSSDWLAPIAAGSLYVRVVAGGQPHLVELFLTLPSGERRLLAASNVASPPPERPSRRPASRAVRVAPGPRGTQLTEVPRSPRVVESSAIQSSLPGSWTMGGRDLALPGVSDGFGGASDTYRR